MQVKVERGKENGKRFFRVFVDGELKSPAEASRILTGCSSWNSGIFHSQSERFYYGHEDKFIEQPENLHEVPIHEIPAILKKRVAAVREWRDSVDYTETIVFDM